MCNNYIEINLPASKSITNRALLLQLFFPKFTIGNISDAHDCIIMQRCILDINNKKKEINIEDTGTACRFLLSYLTITPGEWILRGSDRMHQRPIKPLVDSLRILGGEITYLENEGFLPLKIMGNPEITGGEIDIDANISSQFISSLMMIGWYLKDGIVINLKGEIVSKKYLEVTRYVLGKFLITSDIKDNSIIIKYQNPKYILYPDYTDFYMIENDWSSSSYIFGFVSLLNLKNNIIRLTFDEEESLIQPDQSILKIISDFGVKASRWNQMYYIHKNNDITITEYSYNFINCPDLAQTVICLCAASGINGEFEGLSTLKNKETDRTKALSIELKKVGYNFYEEGEKWMLRKEKDFVYPTIPIFFESYKDHRMAMSLSLFAVHYQIEMDDKEVVKKSFPNYWEEIAKLGVEIKFI